MMEDMALHTSELRRPDCLSKYDSQWAIQLGCFQGGQGAVPAQILVGVDMSRILPVSVVHPDQTPVETTHARLLRSMLTGRYLLYGSAQPDDPLVHVSFPPVVNDDSRAGIGHDNHHCVEECVRTKGSGGWLDEDESITTV